MDMKNKDVEKMIGNAFEKATPNLFDKILEKCPTGETSNVSISFWKKLSNLFLSKKFAYSFSSFILILSISFVWMNQETPITQNVFSVIAIDLVVKYL